MRRLGGAVVTTAVVMVLSAGTAAAATVSGSASDPQDAAIDAATGKRVQDARYVRASHEPETGDLVLEVELWVPLRDTGQEWMELRGALSMPGTSGCTDAEQDMDFSLYVSRYGGENFSYASLHFQPSSGYAGTLNGAVSISGDDRSFVARFRGSPSLVRQNIRCVSHISLSSDEVERFCLGTGNCFQAARQPERPDTKAPSVSWSKPRTGQTISGILSEDGGTCLVNASDASGIAYTENYIDGRFSDRQVNAPWSCEIDTRTLSNGPHTLKVRAYDKAGNYAEASAHITVRNQGPTPPPPPPPPPPARDGGGPTLVTTGPPTPRAEGPRAVVTPRRPATVSRRQAEREARRALAEEYRSFRQRRRYSMRCQRSSRGAQTCAVRWSAKGRRYAGTVRVSRPGSRYVVSMKVRRARR